jgi:uncharacterized protein YaiL (DUF2058 family)
VRHLRRDDGLLVSTPKNTKDMERAQAAFHKKEIQAREGASATADYKAAAHAEREKTARLRKLREAKEAADRAAAAVEAAKPKPAGKKKRT